MKVILPLIVCGWMLESYRTLGRRSKYVTFPSEVALHIDDIALLNERSMHFVERELL